MATCGTALTEDHVRLLKRFARRLVLAFDADAAGQAAAERFYEWEQRARDRGRGGRPARRASTRPTWPAPTRTGCAAAVDGARRRSSASASTGCSAAADLATPEGRARAAEAGAGVIAEHPSELVRDQYVMEVADRCRVDARAAPRARCGARAAAGERRDAGRAAGRAGRTRVAPRVRRRA